MNTLLQDMNVYHQYCPRASWSTVKPTSTNKVDSETESDKGNWKVNFNNLDNFVLSVEECTGVGDAFIMFFQMICC